MIRRILAVIVAVFLGGLVTYYYGTVANPDYDPTLAEGLNNPLLHGELRNWVIKVSQPTIHTPFFWGGILIMPLLFVTFLRLFKDKPIELYLDQRQ
ncbi:hypothetical protein [Paenibacillus sp. FSL H7-0331]|uniref:hypothetical protein n=1 Tax=Paenibacillus sp. FSL H7-0331 TaxID=1920421 RepID=UPI00117F05CB|nr:hypothetical protein [Paenibacillus sp. FSL H7-0331]